MADDQHVEQELPPLNTLAARLEYLFEKIRPTSEEFRDSDKTGRKYTNKEIADKINAMASETGVTISGAYIGELRRGVASDPRTSHIRALASVFGESQHPPLWTTRPHDAYRSSSRCSASCAEWTSSRWRCARCSPTTGYPRQTRSSSSKWWLDCGPLPMTPTQPKPVPHRTFAVSRADPTVAVP